MTKQRAPRVFAVEQRQCPSCGATVEVRTSRQRRQLAVYCSMACRSRAAERTQWPDATTLGRMVENMGYSAVARELGVTATAVKKRVKKLQLRFENPSSVWRRRLIE